MADTMIGLECPKCGRIFERRLGEVNRSKRKGKESYCSRACGSGNLSEEGRKKLRANGKRNAKFLVADNHKDEYSDFRYYMKLVRQRATKHGARVPKDYNIDLDYLKLVWEAQKGLCTFTGELMRLRTHADIRKTQEVLTPYQASLDRIDNSKGYLKGNVRFISVMANYARNKFTDEQVIEFCKKVSNERGRSTE
jgi:hypothetical protein